MRLMMKYGAETPVEHRFRLHVKEVEKRSPWIDVFLSMEPVQGEVFPDDLQDPGILIICNSQGELVQIALQNEDCDCEFQLTYTEKAQVEQFFQEHCSPLLSLVNG